MFRKISVFYVLEFALFVENLNNLLKLCEFSSQPNVFYIGVNTGGVAVRFVAVNLDIQKYLPKRPPSLFTKVNLKSSSSKSSKYQLAKSTVS